MAIKPAIVQVLSEQVVAEYYSGYYYLALSAAADQAGFPGTSHWLKIQAKEEVAHGTHIFEHLLSRDAAPTLSDVKAVAVSVKSMRDIFSQVLAHEEKVTEMINHLASVAMKENDHTTYHFIMWYVNEQIEEVDDVKKIIDQITLAEQSGAALYSLDKELGLRVFNDPFASATAAG